MKDQHVERFEPPEFPPPDHPDFPKIRDEFVERIRPGVWKLMGYEPLDYQRRAHLPPEPYASTRPLVKGLFGAKRIGKSYFLAAEQAPNVFVPGMQIRGYAPEYENAEREFTYLFRILVQGLRGNPPLAKYFPWIKNRLTATQLDPRQGALELRWGGSDQIDAVRILARSWERKNQWLGEPIDRAFFCEPGLLPDAAAWDKLVKPNLSDRRGEAVMAGTVDFPWLHDVIHAYGHDPDTHPDVFCTCEVHRRENPHVWDPKAYERAKATEDSRTLAINWQGKWGVYSETAYVHFDPNPTNPRKKQKGGNVIVIDEPAWLKMKRGMPGWERFLVLDTGRYMALGEFVINTKGVMFMIDEHTNYTYRRGRIEDNRDYTFRPWLARWINRQFLGRDEPTFIIDPTSQFKLDLEHMGLGYQDAVNDHQVGVKAVNEYFGLRALHIDQRHCPTTIFELPRVKWSGVDSGIGGRQHLSRGNDHCADLPRYACATRPLAARFIRERKVGMVERDEAGIMARKNRRHVDEHMGAIY